MPMCYNSLFFYHTPTSLYGQEYLPKKEQKTVLFKNKASRTLQAARFMEYIIKTGYFMYLMAKVNYMTLSADKIRPLSEQELSLHC